MTTDYAWLTAVVPVDDRVPWVADDGGRADADFPRCGDCAARATALALGLKYTTAFAALRALDVEGKEWKDGTPSAATHALLTEYGFVWVKSAARFTRSALPDASPLVVRFPPGKGPSHLAVVIDGVVYDTSDPGREGRRRIDGYWCPA